VLRRVHQARGGPRAARPTLAHAALGQRDRLVDGGVVGAAAAEEELEQPEPQRRGDRSVEAVGLAAGQPANQLVGGAAALDGPVGEPLRAGALRTGQLVALGRGRERAVGPGAMLEAPPQDLIRRSASGVQSAQGTAGAGTGWPRR